MLPPLNAAAALGVGLRPMDDADLPFVAGVYASTREEELAPLGWPLEMRRMFLAQQHAAQHAHYQRHYRGMDAMIVEYDGAGVGRLYLFETPEEVRIVDIALVPTARRQGIGSSLLQDVLTDAGSRGKRVTIHVEKHNPARSLYMRLGFAVLDSDRGVYELMGWRPAV